MTLPCCRNLMLPYTAACLLWAGILVGCAHSPSAPEPTTVTHPDHEKTFPLWPKGAPEAKGQEVQDTPSITVYLPPADKATGTAVVVNPGGGYWVLAADHEGVQVARWLNREGIAAFVVRYRVNPTYNAEVSLTDGKRAMRWARAHANDYGIAADRIGMMGFSAGGNLASAVGTDPEAGAAAGQPGYDDEVERQPTRPDFLLLVYPAISHHVAEKQSLGRSTDLFVGEDTPPSFLVHTHEDNLTPAHSLRFYERLLELKIPAELHVFAHGPHGTGIAAGDPDLGQWRSLAQRWMRRMGFLANGKRVAVTGTLHVNDQPVSHGWLTLTPQNERFPIVTAYFSKKDGAFSIDEAHGPYPGRYKVEAQVLSTPASDMKVGKVSLDDAVGATAASDGQGPLWIDIGATPSRLELKLKATSGKLP